MSKKKRKKNKAESMTEEEIFEFYSIVGYTPSGMPYGITMEEAEEQGLLEEEKKYLKAFEEDYPF
ncbi:hypothetical protein [Atopostipes suicloacalis]|nr:hypothetical protein [Atopostipes suicloacalis]